MRLTPRYGDEPALRVDCALGDVSVPLVRQRARLAAMLAQLDDDEWAAPSRCAGWSVQDVVAHLVGTNRFWTASVRGALAREPTQLLASFDPVEVPAQMVAAARSASPAETLEQYAHTADVLAAQLAGLDEQEWSRPGEAPIGHVALRSVALHALWDAWVHERDVALPLGREARAEPDEVGACVVYAAALSPALLAAGGSTRRAVLSVHATAPDVECTVEIGPTVVVRDGVRSGDGDRAQLAGDAVALVEGLSFRAPAPYAAHDRWLMGGLATAFDAAV